MAKTAENSLKKKSLDYLDKTGKNDNIAPMAIAERLYGSPRPTERDMGIPIEETDVEEIIEDLIDDTIKNAEKRAQKGIRGALVRFFNPQDDAPAFSLNQVQGLIQARKLPALRAERAVMERAALRVMSRRGFDENILNRKENVLINGFEIIAEGASNAIDLRQCPAGDINFVRKTTFEDGSVRVTDWYFLDASAKLPAETLR